VEGEKGVVFKGPKILGKNKRKEKGRKKLPVKELLLGGIG